MGRVSVGRSVELVTWPDPVLNTVAEKVVAFDTALAETVAEMTAMMVRKNGLGLAANQVGLLQRIFVLDADALGGGTTAVYVNPKILEGDGRLLHSEGCLSFPGVFVNMVRKSAVTVAAYDLEGSEFVAKLDGLGAFAFQHELDHLNGITFYDNLSPVKMSMYKNKFRKLKKLKRRKP